MKCSAELAIVAIFLLNGICCHSIQLPTMRVEMDAAGMHRKLKYSVQFDNQLLGMNCEYMLAQPLPAAVYISTDELDDMQRMEMLSAVYPKFVDIEIITEKAKPFSVLLRGTPKITEALTLPIHFRYHAASKKRTKTTVEISTPKLYISCPIGGKELIDSDLVTEKHFCLDKQKSDFVEHLSTIKSADCLWQRVNVDYQAQLPLRAEIPVGDANGYTLVLYTTIALSWAASIWTVLRIHSVSRRINNELSDKNL